MPEAAKGRAAYAAVLSSCLEAAVVIIHAGNEPAPFMSRTAVGQQRGRAILPRPIIMGYHITERNMVLLHQHCRQLGGAVPGNNGVMAPYLPISMPMEYMSPGPPRSAWRPVSFSGICWTARYWSTVKCQFRTPWPPFSMPGHAPRRHPWDWLCCES